MILLHSDLPNECTHTFETMGEFFTWNISSFTEYLSSYLNRVHYGKALSGYEVFVLEDVSFIRCAFACQMNVRCRSINHDVTSRRCTVNSETATSYPAQLTAAPGVSYYTVFIWVRSTKDRITRIRLWRFGITSTPIKIKVSTSLMIEDFALF